MMPMTLFSNHCLARVECVSRSGPEADEVWIDHAPSFATPIILRRHFANREQSRLLVLGDSPQAQADGRQTMGRRLPVSSRGASGRKGGAGRFPERTVPGGRLEILFLTADQRRDCASSSIGNCWNENCWSCDYPRNAKSVTSWMDRAKQQYRDLHRTRIKRRDCHDDGPVKRRRCRCQGTDPRRRGLAGRYHRAGWHPL